MSLSGINTNGEKNVIFEIYCRLNVVMTINTCKIIHELWTWEFQIFVTVCFH